MPIPDCYLAEFEPGEFYHIYNRSVGKEKLFLNPSNFDYFLRKFDEQLSNYLAVYAYCLLPNHFHFMTQVKENDLVLNEKEMLEILERKQTLNDIIIRRFQNFFIGYALAFNNEQERNGTLFTHPFKRILIKEESHLTTLIQYIHTNPERHQLTNDFRNYPYSSFYPILNHDIDHWHQCRIKLKANEVLDWFGGKEFYMKEHLLAQQAEGWMV